MVGRYNLKRISHNHARELRKLFFFFFFFLEDGGWAALRAGAETAETVEHALELRNFFLSR